MKLVFWNEDTQRHEGVNFAEDKWAWATAVATTLLVSSVVSGAIFAIFG